MKLWSIPTFYTVASLLAAMILPRMERALWPDWVHGTSTASAIAFLSAAATGILAFTAIVFSIAFVMVQFSAIAYSPRLVLWFTSKPQIYHALGVFIATFTYAIATLMWVDRDGSGTVPFLSVMLVLASLCASMIAFAMLIQTLAKLQITEVLAMVGDQGRLIIAKQAEFLRGCSKASRESWPDSPLPLVRINYSGIPRNVTNIDFDRLLRLTEKHGLVVRLKTAAGDTIVKGRELMSVRFSAGSIVPEEALVECILLGRQRTFEQDPKYALRLLVDIAIKALSPAINDPTTAVQAMDQIEDLLTRLSGQYLGPVQIMGEIEGAHVIAPLPTWSDYLALSFDEIRHYGADSIQVMRRLQAALSELSQAPMEEAHLNAVRDYTAHLNQTISLSRLDANDQAAARQIDSQGLGFTRQP